MRPQDMPLPTLLGAAALIVPVYCVLRQERGGFVAGAVAFWVLATAALALLPLYGGDPDFALGWYCFGGWFIGVIYCAPIYLAKQLFRGFRRGPSRAEPGIFCCRRCGFCERGAPARCPDCGTPATGAA